MSLGYKCPCGVEHKFDAWALAHQHVDLVHSCTCGLKNTIRRGVVVGARRKRRARSSRH